MKISFKIYSHYTPFLKQAHISCVDLETTGVAGQKLQVKYPDYESMLPIYCYALFTVACTNLCKKTQVVCNVWSKTMDGAGFSNTWISVNASVSCNSHGCLG